MRFFTSLRMTKASLKMTFILLAVLVACQKGQDFTATKENPAEENPATEEVTGNSYTLTVEAAKSMDTKALVLDGSTLNAKWVQDEKVGVYVNGEYCGQLLATPKDDATKATLSGTLTSTSGIAANATLLLLFPDRDDITEGSKWDYTGQNGATPTPEADMSTKYDYATATLTVTGIDGSNVTTTGTATFQNEQSIYRLDFKVNSSLKSVKWFSVSSSQNKLATSRSYSEGWTSAYGGVSVSMGTASSSPYLSLRNENTTEADMYSFMVRDYNNNLYSGTKVIPAEKLGYGQFLAPSVDLSAYSIATTASGNITSTQDIF